MSTRVMTGGMSGFGAIAAKRLTLLGNARLILGTRRPTTVGESIPLDLTELNSVRAFTMSVRERLGDTAVDALVLNAGMIRHDDTGRTVEGFETTFAVNHLAHYLMLRLLRLLLPALADSAIVMLTRNSWRTPIAILTAIPRRARLASMRTRPRSFVPSSPLDRCLNSPMSRPVESP